MSGRQFTKCSNLEELTWLRDCLHVLRDYAQAKELPHSDDAIRAAIIAVSLEAGVPTLLSVRDLVAHQFSDRTLYDLVSCAHAS